MCDYHGCEFQNVSLITTVNFVLIMKAKAAFILDTRHFACKPMGFLVTVEFQTSGMFNFLE